MPLDGQVSLFVRNRVFVDFVCRENSGMHAVRLLQGHRRIHDCGGSLREVEREKVTGQQFVIPPGLTCEDSSFSVPGTDEESMVGAYPMRREAGEQSGVAIPRFVLRAVAN